MNKSTLTDAANRQVLVNLGNRFVVFGLDTGAPALIHFDPNESAILPRVADETESAEFRISETLQVTGMTRAKLPLDRTASADIELMDSNGNRIAVDVKVRERDPKQQDIQFGLERLNIARSNTQNLEIWFFNIERLKLTVMRLDGTQLKIDELAPLNVWEKTQEGVFDRKRVVEEVEDWLSRIEQLYLDIQGWLSDKEDLQFEQNRTVTMSEEMMQQFAVIDRELKILDVLRGNQVLASFVPRGLWIIGAWGRIDVITDARTSILVAVKVENKLEWRLSSSDKRRIKNFDREGLLELLGGL